MPSAQPAFGKAFTVQKAASLDDAEGDRVHHVKFGDGTAVLKKFFVYEPYRGAPCHLGRQLYGTLLDYARTHGVKQLILDTPKNTDRAHKFYERAGFTKIERADVPVVNDFP